MKKIGHLFALVKFSHSIFALPFALGAMVAASGGWPGTKTFLLILAAMVTARSAAMAFNRIVDAEIDAKNPRTQNRHIPQGILSKKSVSFFTVVCCAAFLTICYCINSLSFFLSPLILIWLLAYSYAKRFTWGSHLWLGVSLGSAPLAAWVAVTNDWPWPALALGVAVAFWVAGFDIIYACQDFEFDRREKIHSLTARFGLAKALKISRLFHAASLFFLVFFGAQNGLGAIYHSGVALIGAGLVYEQSLVKPDDLSKVNAAFFNANGMISLLFFFGILFERFAG